MPHIIKVVTPPHPPNGFHNEFVEYVRKYDIVGIHLVREQAAALEYPTRHSAEYVAQTVREHLPLRTVSVVPLGEEG